MKKFFKYITCAVFLTAALTTCGLSASSAPSDLPVKKKLVALTFDDGPCAHDTARILDILAKYNVKATFFVIGKSVKLHPELLIREAAEGHEIGNHTYTHPEIRTEGLRDLMDEVERTDDLIYDLLGIHTSLFRPPQGICTESVLQTARDCNYEIILWDVDTNDWTGRGSYGIIDSVKRKVKDGDIILFHDYVAYGGHTVEALEILLPWLLENGYTPVTVSELAAP